MPAMAVPSRLRNAEHPFMGSSSL